MQMSRGLMLGKNLLDVIFCQPTMIGTNHERHASHHKLHSETWVKVADINSQNNAKEDL